MKSLAFIFTVSLLVCLAGVMSLVWPILSLLWKGMYIISIISIAAIFYSAFIYQPSRK